jgi:predicted DNA-binding protein (UPF0251 family)
MPKPKKDRYVMFPPQVVLFKPQGIPAIMLEQIILNVDEYEAIRLIDYEGLDQEAAASRLGVSRATCARILESAHKKIAEALSQGKAIRIEGGSYVLKQNLFRCRDCGAVWEGEEPKQESSEPADECPVCQSDHIIDLSLQVGGRGAPGSNTVRGSGSKGAFGGWSWRRGKGRRW